MKELSRIEKYTELKETLRDELNNQSLGFVRTGYLLKRARDTGMIEEGGYKTVFEFAEAEFGLKKDVTSRYMAINDRYSEGGYSDRLQEQYQGYGVGKLQDMLTLPLEVVNMISPQMTRSEIGEIKAEIKAEEAVTPMELLLEGKNEKQDGMDICQKAMHQYCHDHPQDFLRMEEAFREETQHDMVVGRILDALAPSGINTVRVRIQGEGMTMIAFQGESAPIEILKVKSNEHMELPWTDFIAKVREIFPGIPGMEGKEWWESIYQEAFPKEETELPSKAGDKKKEEAALEKKQEKEIEIPKTSEETAQEEPVSVAEKGKVAPVQQNTEEEVQEPTKETETPEGQQDNQEEVLEQPEEEIGEEVLSGEVETPSDGGNTETEDKLKLSREAYEKQIEKYKEELEAKLEDARDSVFYDVLSQARDALQDALAIVNVMIKLEDRMEEEEES